MSEEEAKALLLLVVMGKDLSDDEFRRVVSTIANMAERLAKENKKKDKMIDLFLDKIVRVHSENPEIEFIANFDIEHKKTYVKEYFRKKVENE